MANTANPQIEIEVLDKLISTVREQPARAKWTFTQWALLAVLILISAAWIYGFVESFFTTKIRNIEISDTRIVGSSNLCPGELLTIAFHLKADGTGKLVEDATVWIEIPP